MTRTRIAALVAALATLAASGALVASRGTRDGDTYRLTAYFSRAIGLFPRSTVRVLGVEVGRVASVVPEGTRVRVDMDVDDDVKVPRDASAVIVPISLISDRYVQLTPVYRGGPVMRSGDVIPVERGVAPAELDDLLETLRDLLQALEPGAPGSPGALGQLVVNADQALAGKGEALGGTVEGLSSLLDALARNVDRLDGTITGLDRLLEALGRKDAQLAATNEGMAKVFGALAEERGRIEQGLGNVAELLGETGRLVRDHRAELLRDILILSDTTQLVVRQREPLVRNVLWLPVLSQGFVQATDTTVTPPRIRVRDNQGARRQ